jgi:hypothetical protein
MSPPSFFASKLTIFTISLHFCQVSSPATEETGAMGREIESRRGICREVVFKKKARSTNLNLARFSSVQQTRLLMLGMLTEKN